MNLKEFVYLGAYFWSETFILNIEDIQHQNLQRIRNSDIKLRTLSYRMIIKSEKFLFYFI